MSQFKIITDTAPSLSEAQDFVGGYVQLVSLDNGDQLLMDEEGSFKCLNLNPEAAAHAAAHGRPDLHRLVGPVLCLQGAARWT